MQLSTREARPPTRRDHSGLLTARLTRVLERGVGLGEEATLIECPVDLASFGRQHRAWVRDCLPVLADAFERETVLEFLHANARIPSNGQISQICIARQAAVAVMGDALELLRGLRGTLEQHVEQGAGD